MLSDGLCEDVLVVLGERVGEGLPVKDDSKLADLVSVMGLDELAEALLVADLVTVDVRVAVRGSD